LVNAGTEERSTCGKVIKRNICNGLKPCAVAAHKDDLVAANACGLQTAFIERPLEFGPHFQREDLHREEFTNYHAKDLNDLASQLYCGI
jgi:hypothetical protein